MSTVRVHTIAELIHDEQICSLGALNPIHVSAILSLADDNLEVVLTGERRRHYRERHAGIERYEGLLQVLSEPDEVHRNISDPQVAIFYLKVDEKHFLRAAGVLALQAGEKKHSVVSFYLDRAKKVRKARKRGQVVWQRV